MPNGYEQYKNFVTEEDFIKLTEFCKKGYAITLRECGKASVERLSQGAGAKPHDILDKSLSENRLASLRTDKFNALSGFVGKWIQGEPEGIFLTNYGAEQLKGQYGDYIKKDPDKTTRSFFCISDPDALDKLKHLLETPDNLKYFFAGDYDIHDHIQKVSGWNYLIEETSAYKTFFSGIAETLRKAPSGISEEYAKDYDRIQHGAQFGYLAFMLNNEVQSATVSKPMKISKTVSCISYPLAACKCGDWSLIKDENDYKDFIKGMGLEPKSRWFDGKSDAYFKHLEDTYRGLIKFMN